jgi:hypothetical protein
VQYTEKGLDIQSIEIPSPFGFVYKSGLCLPNSEHFRATGGAYTLSRWLTILHGYAFRIFHLLLGSALNAVCLHYFTSFLSERGMNHKPLYRLRKRDMAMWHCTCLKLTSYYLKTYQGAVSTIVSPTTSPTSGRNSVPPFLTSVEIA